MNSPKESEPVSRSPSLYEQLDYPTLRTIMQFNTSRDTRGKSGFVIVRGISPKQLLTALQESEAFPEGWESPCSGELWQDDAVSVLSPEQQEAYRRINEVDDAKIKVNGNDLARLYKETRKIAHNPRVLESILNRKDIGFNRR